MRVLMIQNGLAPYTIQRLKALLDCGRLSITLATVSTGERGRPDEAFEHPDLKHITVGSNELEDQRLSSLAWPTIKVIQKTRPDVLFTGGWSPAYLSVAALCARLLKIPAFTFSDSTNIDQRFASWISQLVKDQIKREVLKGYGRILVPGVRAREHLEAFGYPMSRVVTSGHSVGTQSLQEKARAIPEHDDMRLLQSCGIDQPGYLLFVGRLAEAKNPKGLLRAWARALPSLDPSARLVIVGDGELREALPDLARQLKIASSVVFAGYRTSHELISFYRQARALVLPSVLETWGLVVNEAMSFGKPALVSERCGCAPDLVGESNPWIVDPSNLDDIARGLIHASTTRVDPADLSERLKAHSMARYVECFVAACYDLVRH